MPILGLVCQTVSDEIRYRTITRTRLLALDEPDRTETLRELYDDNARRLQHALEYCVTHGIKLYRLPTGIFPFMDHDAGEPVIQSRALRMRLKRIGKYAKEHDVRLVAHPDQFVVLNSERPEVIDNSLRVLKTQAELFDLLGLPLTPWAAITLHGGKGGRSTQLISAVQTLPDNVRRRLVLENDERAYGAAEILHVCRMADVPMVFDAHHHLVKERLASYDDDSIAYYTAQAAQTWNPPDMQLTHISNGAASLHDIRHSERITAMPIAFATVPYIEVEAKGKEEALFALRQKLSSTKRTVRYPRARVQ